MLTIDVDKYIQKIKIEVSDEDRQKLITDIETLISNGDWCKDNPPYQTKPNLFDRKEDHWISFKKKIEKVFNLQKNQKLRAWAYVSLVGKKGSLGNLWHSHHNADCYTEKDNVMQTSVFYLQNENKLAGTVYMIEDTIVCPKVDNDKLYMFKADVLHTPPYWDYENSKTNRIVLAIDSIT